MIWGWDRRAVVQCRENIMGGLRHYLFPPTGLLLAALQDRNIMRPSDLAAFQEHIAFLRKTGVFADDPGDFHRFHGPEACGSWREAVPWCSMHIVEFRSGVFEIHYDLCNPDAGLLPAIGHALECAWSGPTNPFRVARGLRRRGLYVVLVPRGEA